MFNCSEFHFSEVTFFQNWYFNYQFFLDRETNIVHVFHADTAEWTFQEKKLPKPLFSHGCNLVTLKDGRNGILTVGGFTTEGIPAVIPNTNNTFFLNLCPVHLIFEML